MKFPRKQPSNTGPPSPVLTPPGLDGDTCTIIFGHNTETKLVLMMFGVSADRLIFTVAEARDVASKLQHYADMASGEKAH